MLNKRILFGEQHLRRTLNSFVDHHHQDRPHQSLGNKPIAPTNDEPPNGDRVVVDERLGKRRHSCRTTRQNGATKSITSQVRFGTTVFGRALHSDQAPLLVVVRSHAHSRNPVR
tara:strand:+ start:527 stop:868 length:342 start_codon:yes stop_codon:yes gene_type:complete